MHKGSCLCGKITFEIDQKISQINYLFCPVILVHTTGLNNF